MNCTSAEETNFAAFSTYTLAIVLRSMNGFFRSYRHSVGVSGKSQPSSRNEVSRWLHCDTAVDVELMPRLFVC